MNPRDKYPHLCTRASSIKELENLIQRDWEEKPENPSYSLVRMHVLMGEGSEGHLCQFLSWKEAM